MTTLKQYRAAVAEYLTRLQFQNLQPTTLRNYSRALRLFGDFLAQNTGTTDLCEAVEAWKQSLLLQGAQPSTVNQYLTEISIFFDKASKRSFPKELRFPENPVREVEAVKEIKRPYSEILTDTQIKLLYRNEPPAAQFKPTWARNWAMVMLLLNEKIRNAELLDLRLSDVDALHHELTVRNGKGRKLRCIDLCPLTEAAISLYLESGLRPAYLSPEDYLFGTTAAHEKSAGRTAGAEKWHRGTTAWVSGIVERTVKAVTGVESVRSHDLRHVGSRVCLNAGESIEQLQGELGHSQLATTQIYSGRLQQRRRRESAQAVLQARNAAAEQTRQFLDKRAQREQSTKKGTA